MAQKPPSMKLKGKWINQTLWMEALERYNQQQMSSQNIIGTYNEILQSLRGVLPPEVYTVYHEMLKWFLDQMDQLPDGNISLSDFLKGGRLLQQWFNNGTRIAPEVVDIILNAWMKNPSEIIQMFTAKDAMYKLCNMSRTEQERIFAIKTEDVSNFYNSLCQVNSSELYQEIVQLLNIAPTIIKLQNQNLTQFNFTEFRINSMRLEKIFNDFMSNLPGFTLPTIDEARMTKLLQDFYSKFTNYDPAMLTKLFEGIIEGATPSVSKISPTVSTYFKTYKIFQDYFNIIFEQVRPRDGSIRLGNLVKNTTRLGSILMSMEGFGPDLVQNLAAISVHVDKVRYINVFIINLSSDLQSCSFRN